MSGLQHFEAKAIALELAAENLIHLVVAMAYANEFTVDAMNKGWLDDLGDEWTDLTYEQLAVLTNVLKRHVANRCTVCHDKKDHGDHRYCREAS